MTINDRSCPTCGSEDHELNSGYAGYRCLKCGSVWQEVMETDTNGDIVGIKETIVIQKGHNES